ncbi:glycosyltransferase family 4 protein [Aegicerativicinus sediminis]|uniref:glycosyltransferase family 4 protein n=1 Tax=Aegicerativicinus sediminis TaxID=2893202 RepID=UPI001E3FC3CC|nr:glycosyltransferase family 4 protein [Aegicerativicinus sediminis]
MKKEITIITNYFPPEMGAASNRIYQLAKSLKEKGHKITVVTPLPNYPEGKIFKGYNGKLTSKTTVDGIAINRLWLLPSKSKDKLWRVLSITSYCLSLSLYFLFTKLPRTVIIQSPPLFVAFTSVFWLKSKSRKLILNVSDLWPLAGKELKAIKSKKSLSLLEQMEAFNYRKSNIILGQSAEILHHISTLEPKKPTLLYRNFPNFNAPEAQYESDLGKKKMVYAGLLGIAQGIYGLCQKLDYSKLEFHIYGSGPEEEQIKTLIAEQPELNVQFHGSLPRQKLHEEIVQYDFAIVPLRNRIYGSVPSKIFEYAHLGLPMIYFAGGEGGELVAEFNLGWVVEPANFSELNILIKNLKIENYSTIKRSEIKEMAKIHFENSKQINELEKIL